MTFHRIDTRIVRLVDGLAHTVLGYQDMGHYLLWCGGYLAPEQQPPTNVPMPTCFFCLMQIKGPKSI